MSRAALANGLNIPEAFLRRMEAEQLLSEWPAQDVERYMARLSVIRGARKLDVPLSTAQS